MDVETIWQVPAVAHFVYLFREAFKLPEITYDELEEALLTLTSIANSQEKNGADLKPLQSVDFRDLNQITDQVNGTIYNTTYLTNEPKDILIQLICVLLRGCFSNAEINLTNWEYYLVKRFDSTDENQSSPFFEKRVNNDGNIYDHYIAFHEQPIEKKAQILYELCEHRLYAKERPSKVDELEEDELRVEPIGQDSQGCLYFYFFGTRLYRENPKLTRKIEEKRIKIQRLEKLELRTQVISKRSKLSHKKNNPHNQSANISKVGFSNSLDLSLKDGDAPIVKPEITVEELREAWCCVCKTEQDWIDLTEKFKKSKAGSEKELYTVLNDNFLPSMNQMFLKIQRNNERKMRYLNQRNSCRLMAKRFQAEEEERQKELEKGNERENRAKRRAN